jgi:hypothetical protein
MLKTAGAAFAVALLFTTLSFAQGGRFDVSINGAGVFTSESSGNGVTQSATNGANFFGTFRFRFKPKHSFIFNYGHARNSQIFDAAANNFHVQNSIAEYGGAYVFSPLRKGSFEPFFLAGAAALRFSPDSTWVFFPDLPDGTHNRVQVNVNATTQTQVAFLYGLGLDYRLPHFSRFALRLQYRGFLYKAPDFHVDASSGNLLSFFTGGKAHMAEPSVGLVFRF